MVALGQTYFAVRTREADSIWQAVSLNVMMTTPLHVPESGFRSLAATAEDVLAIPLMIG